MAELDPGRQRPGSLRDTVLDAVLRHAPVLVFALDADGTCTYSDGAALHLLGLRPGEVVGRNVLEMYADDPETLATVRRALRGETFRSTYYRGDEPSLNTFWIPTMEDGTVVGTVAIAVDVTDQLRAERDSALYRAFVDAAPQFMAIADLDGAVRYVNPKGRQLVQMPDHVDVTSTRIPDYLTPRGVVASQEIEQPAVLSHGQFEGETSLRNWETGDEIPVRASSFLVHDPLTGAPTAQATVQTDISEIVQARRAMEQALAYQRGLLLHLHEAQEAERKRIAGDVHDDTIQVLAALNLRLHTLRRRLAVEVGDPALLAGIDDLDRAVREATARLRAILVELDPPSVLDVGLEQLVRQQAESTLHTSGVRLQLDVDILEQPAETVGRIMLRIVQEALSNVRKHAQARHAWVSVTQSGGEYRVLVRDDGVGLPGPADREAHFGRHLGVRSMSDRTESVGGWCTVGPAPGGGTQVEARLPVRLGHADAGQSGASPRVFLEQTMDSLTDAYVALGKDWRYVYMNSAGYALFERDPADSVVGKLIWEEFDIAPEFEAAYRRAQAEQVPIELRGYHTPWGKWIENRIFPTSAGLSIFARDVTAEVRAAEELAAQRRASATGRDMTAILTGERDLIPALSRAASLLVEAWGLTGLRLSGYGSYADIDISIGLVDRGDDDVPRRYLPLRFAGHTIATVELLGDSDEITPDLLHLLALRIHGSASGT